MWGINTQHNTQVRLFIVIAGFAIVGILAVESLRYINKKQDGKALKLPTVTDTPAITEQLPIQTISSVLEQPRLREQIKRIIIEIGTNKAVYDIDKLRTKK